MEAHVGVAPKGHAAMQLVLVDLLADEYVLLIKTRKYHWNVTGPTFHDLHGVFGAQYEALNTLTDDIAERLRQLGPEAPGTMTEFLKYATLTETPGKNPDALGMVKDLLADHEALIQTLRGHLVRCRPTCDDLGTLNFLTDVLQSHEKTAWMLRATVEGGAAGRGALPGAMRRG